MKIVFRVNLFIIMCSSSFFHVSVLNGFFVFIFGFSFFVFSLGIERKRGIYGYFRFR